jgi:hypothetical protein
MFIKICYMFIKICYNCFLLYSVFLLISIIFVYQKQIVNTIYNRAKFHPNQTHNMKVFIVWLKKINKRYNSIKKY